MSNKDLEWQAPEFEHWEKPRVWYLVLYFIGTIIFTSALWQSNFLFAIFTIIAMVTITFHARRSPRQLSMRLSDEALTIDMFHQGSSAASSSKVYLYEQFSGFATRRVDGLEDGLSELVLQRKHRLGNYLRILYPTKRTQDVRHFLNNHLPEIEYEDTLSDHFFRWLKF